MYAGGTPTDEQLQANVVVVGGGGSGLAATVAAVENGAGNVILLEKRPVLGGNSVFPGGMLAAETALQRRLGYDTRRDDVFRQMMKFSHWKLDARLIRALVDKTPDNIAWLEAKGVKFSRLVPHYSNQVPLTYHQVEGTESTGSLVIKTLGQIARDSGVRLLFQTAATKLLTDDRGGVMGVLAAARDREISIAARSVILATGGFAGNPDLIRRFDPSYREDEMSHSGLPHKGDATMMAAQIGAAIEGMVLETEGQDFPWSKRVTVAARRPSTVWVNRNGERFADEDFATVTEGANAIIRQPGRASYCLFDEHIKERIAREGLSAFEALFLGDESLLPGLEEDLQNQAAEGRVKISNSWDEIAAWMGAPPEALKATIDQYNSCCDRGHDDLFVKDPRYLLPLRTPPFYAIRCFVALLTTHGGPRINHRMEVLDQQQKPIPGLYAVGAETGGKESDTYNMYASGHSFGFSIASGRIAGENAARYASGI